MPKSWWFCPAIVWLAMLAAGPLMAAGDIIAQDKPKVEVVSQIGHSEAVISVALSADGRFVLSGSGDRTLKLWEMDSGRLLRTFEGHSDRINSVAYSPDGHTVLSGSGDRTLKLWEMDSGRLLRTFEGHSDQINSVAYSPDGRTVLSGSEDDTLKMWDVATGKLLRTIKGHSSAIYAMVLSSDGYTALTGGYDRTIKIWDLRTGKLLRTLSGHSGPVNSIALSPDGRTVISGSQEDTLRVWDAATGKMKSTFDRDFGGVRNVAFSPNGRTVLSAINNDTIELWDAGSGKLLRTFKGNSDVIAFSPDSRSVISGGKDKPLELWDAATGQALRTFGGNLQAINSIAFLPDSRFALSGGNDRMLKLWDLGKGRLLRSFEGHSASVHSVALSADGRTVISASEDQTLKLWDVAEGKLLRTFQGHSGPVESVAFSPDGRTALSSSRDGTVKLWDVGTGSMLRDFETKYRVGSLAFSPNGSSVLAASSDSIYLWDLATNSVLHNLARPTWTSSPLAFSPDGLTVLVGIHATFGQWEVATGKLLRTFEGHSGRVESVAFSPDGRTVLSGSEDHTLRLWEVDTGNLLRIFEGHSGSVTSVALSPDGGTVLSGSRDGTLRLWSRQGGSEVMRLLANSNGDWVAITSSGFFDLGGDAEKLLHLVQGLGVLSIGQTFEQLYRPDLIQAVLNGDSEGKYADAAHDLNLKTILESGPAPQIEHLAEKDDGVGGTIRISLRITGKGGGVGNHVVWKVNGVTQGNTTPPALASADGPLASAVVTETLKLVTGQVNVVEVTAYNHAGLVATPPFKITVDKFGTATADRPRMFVLALGVNNYRMKDYKLSYAATDATSLSKALEIVGSPLFAEVKTATLTDEQVNEAEISSAFDKISQEAKPEDVFVLFLGGHGRSIAGQYYYYPQTLDFADHQSVKQNGIGQDKWEGWLAKITAQKSLLLIDTCEGDAFRGSRGTDTARQTAMIQLRRATGRNVISAARDAAYEGYHGHGVLTYALIEALDIKAAHGGDERVRVNSLADYVEQRVPEITKSSFGVEQVPTHKLIGNDFPIGIRQAVLETSGEGPAIPREPEHVLIRAELVRERPSADAPGWLQLVPGTKVRAVEFIGSWVIIARDGQKLGYVPAEALARMQ